MLLAWLLLAWLLLGAMYSLVLWLVERYSIVQQRQDDQMHSFDPGVPDVLAEPHFLAGPDVPADSHVLDVPAVPVAPSQQNGLR